MRVSIVIAVSLLSLATAAPSSAQDTAPTVGDYYEELEKNGLVDIDSGSRDTLIAELRAAEQLLRDGAVQNAAVALYAIVESPRYQGFEEFVEFQNARYYLGVALSRSGATDAALHYLLQTMADGPSALYFAPAHRKAVDIALATHQAKEVLGQLEGLKLNEPVGKSVAGERAYLRARVAYDNSDFKAAEAELVKISRKSRMYSSALYLRGVIRSRKGQFQDAADNFCEIAATPDDDVYTFVVDERYFRIKDLARLGLARIAHETNHYDNAYYHYFQIPEDSDKLGDALFESGWSMYQKRELSTARDLIREFLKQFPHSPKVPEARLLAGYIELADCEFDAAQKQYDQLVRDLPPIIKQIDILRNNPSKRGRLFDTALKRWRSEKAEPDERRTGSLAERLHSKSDQVLALLRLDAQFVTAHQSVLALRSAAGDAPHVTRTWVALGEQVSAVKVRVNRNDREDNNSDGARAQALLGDLEHLRDTLVQRRRALKVAIRNESIGSSDAAVERTRLDALDRDIQTLQSKTAKTAERVGKETTKKIPDGLKPLIRADIMQSRKISRDTTHLIDRLERKADTLAKEALDTLHRDIRQVLDKAKLGKIDSVIGQKRKLEIEVQDLAAGRFPAELHGKMWEQGLIEDDEEFWPFEGEFWADEYEGWR